MAIRRCDPCTRDAAVTSPALRKRSRPQPSQRYRSSHPLPATTPTAAAAAASAPQPLSPHAQHQRHVEAVFLSSCAATFFAAVHRQTFSVLAVPIQRQFGFTTPELGVLQAAILGGYVLGQVPSGVLSDAVGGARFLVLALFVWSAAHVLFAATPYAANPLRAMVAARATLGLTQSCLMPAIGAASARWFPDSERARRTSTAWAVYSIGTVAGLAGTPFVATALGWQAAFVVYGAMGMVAAGVAFRCLPSESGIGKREAIATASTAAPPAAGSEVERSRPRLGRRALRPLAFLCFTHSVIGFGFFVYQAWLPFFFSSLGLESLALVGALSSLPWVATAAMSILGGHIADHLHLHRAWSTPAVRKLMQTIAFTGSLFLLPLVLAPSPPHPGLAAAILTAALAMQGFSYSGFHTYCQEVAPQHSGLVLGITNTCGILAGMAGNVATGYLAAGPWGFRGVFGLTIGLCGAGAVVWLVGADGKQLEFET